MSGIFITFEGIEGCGKSTQIVLLHDWLVSCGYSVVMTREPGGTEIGENIRELLRRGNKHDIFSSRAELLLFEASRAQHMEEIILPSLNANKVVLCDRFFDSTVVYQGVAREIHPDTVKFLNEFATFDKVPDWTVLLDITVEESEKRLLFRNIVKDRIEQESSIFFEKVRSGYLKIANCDNRFSIINGQHDSNMIHEEIRNEFRRRFF